ncbi:MAG: SRPBCC domain-containing protein [Gemmatimonadaceae bacterium]|nr:SRPBCC domain-containing protein [Chitinophagaceae bacterium]
MKTDLLFDFSVDKANRTVVFKREFAADQSLVWDAFTKQEILDQWWAPKPWLSKTKHMNFEVGGRRFYAMVSPDGMEKWSVQRYTSITPITNFKMLNSFADKDENPELPGSQWDLSFREENENTTVTISIYNESQERFEKMLEMGFKEGFTMTTSNLETLLATLSKR